MNGGLLTTVHIPFGAPLRFLMQPFVTGKEVLGGKNRERGCFEDWPEHQSAANAGSFPKPHPDKNQSRNQRGDARPIIPETCADMSASRD